MLRLPFLRLRFPFALPLYSVLASWRWPGAPSYWVSSALGVTRFLFLLCFDLRGESKLAPFLNDELKGLFIRGLCAEHHMGGRKLASLDSFNCADPELPIEIDSEDARWSFSVHYPCLLERAKNQALVM